MRKEYTKEIRRNQLVVINYKYKINSIVYILYTDEHMGTSMWMYAICFSWTKWKRKFKCMCVCANISKSRVFGREKKLYKCNNIQRYFVLSDGYDWTFLLEIKRKENIYYMCIVHYGINLTSVFHFIPFKLFCFLFAVLFVTHAVQFKTVVWAFWEIIFTWIFQFFFFLHFWFFILLKWNKNKN